MLLKLGFSNLELSTTVLEDSLRRRARAFGGFSIADCRDHGGVFVRWVRVSDSLEVNVHIALLPGDLELEFVRALLAFGGRQSGALLRSVQAP